MYRDVRPPPVWRCFSSPAVEETIRDTTAQIRDRELAWLFANCFPNTLDTTIRYHEENGTPDMHEAFWKDDPARFTRSWFAWANSLFGEAVLHVVKKWPGLA